MVLELSAPQPPLHPQEARCFVVNGEVVECLYTRFARIDNGGYVRDYEKAHSAEEATLQPD
eukprot:7478717-Alexandrium_andersonii.AAC.1